MIHRKITKKKRNIHTLKKRKTQKGGKNSILRRVIYNPLAGVVKAAVNLKKRSCKTYILKGQDPKLSPKRVGICNQKKAEIQNIMTTYGKKPTIPTSYNKIKKIIKLHKQLKNDNFIKIWYSLRGYDNIINKQESSDKGFRIMPTNPNLKKKKKFLTLLGYNTSSIPKRFKL